MQRAAAIVRSQKALPVKKAAAKKSEWKVYDMIHKKTIIKADESSLKNNALVVLFKNL